MIAEIIGIYFLYCFLYLCTGVIEGILWSKKASEAFPWNEHIPLAIWRGMIGCTLWMPALPVDHRTVLSVTILLAFFFWHETGLYESRKRIDVPEYGYNKDSTTSTAKTNISWPYRKAGLILSVAILGVYTIFFV